MRERRGGRGVEEEDQEKEWEEEEYKEEELLAMPFWWLSLPSPLISSFLENLGAGLLVPALLH